MLSSRGGWLDGNVVHVNRRILRSVGFDGGVGIFLTFREIVSNGAFRASDGSCGTPKNNWYDPLVGGFLTVQLII